MEPAAHAIITRLCGMPQTPDEVQVEFGLDLHAEAGASAFRRAHDLRLIAALAGPAAGPAAWIS